MLRYRLVLALAGSLALITTANVAADDHKTVPAFMELFKIFPRDQGPNTIGSALARAMATGKGAAGAISPQGPLVIVNQFGVFIYDGTSRALIGAVETRDNPATGVFEMTALSHIGPAIAYLAALNEAGSPDFEPLLRDLLKRVRAARAANSASNPYWATTVDAPAWASHTAAIRRMVDYGLWMAGDFLVKVRNKKILPFNSAAVGEKFYRARDKEYPIPFDNVMIATFVLVSLNSVDRIRRLVVAASDKIDWPNAKVVVHMPIGSNYTAGLTIDTNQLAAALVVVTDSKLPVENVLIAPYANAPCPAKAGAAGCTIDVFEAATLNEAVFNFYSRSVWYGIYNRTRVAASAFPGVTDIKQSDPPKIPGDYGYTKADDIRGFIQRLKLSFTDKRQLLSNAVGYWVPWELQSKGWDASKVDIPGLTTGFPVGVSGYPQDLPAIPD